MMRFARPGLCAVFLMLLVGPAFAQQPSMFDLPVLKLEANPAGGQSLSLSLQALVLMSALTLLPSLLLVTTSFAVDIAAGAWHAAKSAQPGDDWSRAVHDDFCDDADNYRDQQSGVGPLHCWTNRG